ncbi:NADP-dependent oxidoreductase [Sphingomonas crocodyli]|uniref:NADP-dependent oxidoreductase n=2 Tax=Sphingomonas crocodyli TaxID=1979270 RepID=A0A437LV18_9SPHN|nr:NADP-dependent oxidoreductase [Sphingomonas crocodyli]
MRGRDAMKAMVIDGFGGPEVFRVADMPKPEPAEEQVLIRVAYASINPADWKTRAGLLPVVQGPFPMVVGMDCAGVVEAVGPGVTAFVPGDKVIAMSGLGQGMSGSYAEYACVPEMRVLKLPSALTLAEGATIPTAAASAASTIIEVARVAPGSTVFFSGGAGSVGTFGVQYLKWIGCKVATTCSTRNVDHVASLGVDRVIDYTKEDTKAALAAWAPEGVDAIIDAVGQHSLPADIVDVIRPGGVLVVIQNLLTDVEAYDLDGAKARGIRVVNNIMDARKPDARWFQVEAWRELVKGIEAGAIRTPPYEVLPLEQAGAGQARVEDGHVRGKILLKIGDI